jgi:SAM-dependent methyltransferase
MTFGGLIKMGNDLKKLYEDYYGFPIDKDITNNGIRKNRFTNGTIEGERENAFKWDQLIRVFYDIEHDSLWNHKIIDIGCGNGQDLRKMIELGAKPRNCYGVDIIKSAIDYAVKNSPPDINYHVGMVNDLECKNSTFDTIFCFNIITSYAQNDYIYSLCKELRRIIKDTGVLFIIANIDNKSCISTPVSEGISTRNFTMDEIAKLFSSFDIKMKVSCSLRQFTQELPGVNEKDFERLYEQLLRFGNYSPIPAEYVGRELKYLLRLMLTRLELADSNRSILVLRPK